MGEPKKLTCHKVDKKKIAINVASGGGIGGGIILIGGALATAALVSALTVGRRLLKSSNSKNRNHCQSTGSTETPENLTTENISADKDESKGLLFLPPDSSSDMHQNLSNGAAKTSITEADTSGISSKSFFPEEKHNLEPYSRKPDPICDDKEILLSSGLHGSDSSKQCDASVGKTEEFSLPVVEDQTLYLPASMNEDPYDGEIEMIEEENIIGIPDVDHRTEEDSQLMQVNIDQKVKEVKCIEAAETADADHSALIILQSNEELESTLTDHDQDSNSTGFLPSKSSVSVDQDSLVPVLYNSSLCKDEKLKINCKEGSQAFEKVETLEGEEAVKAVHVDKGHGNSMILMMEEKEKKCDQNEVWLITETAEQLKRDETLEASHADQDKVNGAILMFEEEEKICSQHDGSLIVQTVEVLRSDEDADQADEGNSGLLIVPTVEVLKRDEKLDADQEDGGDSSNVITSGEEEEKFDQHEGRLTVEITRGLAEDKALEPAQGKDETEILMLGKEIGAPHDDENDAAGEAANLADAIDSVSSSDLLKQLTEEQENPPTDSQEDHRVPDMITSEEFPFESCAAQEPNLSLEAQGVPSESEHGIGFDSNLKQIELLVEASEMSEEIASSEPASEESEDRVTESDINPLKQSIGNTLEEIEDTPATTETYNVGVTGQMEMSEEDSIDDDTDEANITDKVEENSEGTGDHSSVDYNAEPIWPAESLEELSMDLTKLKLNDQKEKQQAEEKLCLNNFEDRGTSVENLQKINEGKDNSKMTFLEKYMLELAEQNDQQTNSLKPRILDLTRIFMVLFWPLCFWYFGLPFWKISLIIILVIVLSKIQGT